MPGDLVEEDQRERHAGLADVSGGQVYREGRPVCPGPDAVQGVRMLS